MTLDEVITLLKFNNKHISDLKNDDLQQIAEWLEDYKRIKQWKSDVMEEFCKYDVSSFEELVTNARNKAIDDFVNAYEKQFTTMYGQRYVDMRDIVNIAEQLKVGGNNDD